MRVLPCGDRAVLVEVADGDHRDRLAYRLRASARPDVVDIVPGARTVLVTLSEPAALTAVTEAIATIDLREPVPAATDAPLEIPVRYNGPDLPTVARHLSVSEREVVERHTGQEWRVEFTGFAPGFGYLTGTAGNLTVPRRDDPRTRVPAGSVALADDYTGIYPRSSPGGWQLIGSTDALLWDADREPPALLAPGRSVRFRSVD